MRFRDYLSEVARARAIHPQWWRGLALFNVLAEVRPDLGECIRGSDIDPFYGCDAEVEAKFLAFVEAHLNAVDCEMRLAG